MNSEPKDVELEQLLSSYGLITIERILSRYQIRLTLENLLALTKNHFSFYHYILQIPLKNVLNGIVIQQAHDYYVYVQKLYIDYLLSGDSAADEEAPGGTIRESLEEERKRLVGIGDDFHQLELAQDAIIAKSQVYLFGLTKEWHTEFDNALSSLKKTIKNLYPDNKLSAKIIKQAIEHGLLYCDLKEFSQDVKKFIFIDKINEVLKLPLTIDNKEKLLDSLSNLMQLSLQVDEKLADFYPEVNAIHEKSRVYRQEIYDAILRAIPLIKLLPVYRIDEAQDVVNRELLYFDKTIGE